MEAGLGILKGHLVEAGLFKGVSGRRIEKTEQRAKKFEAEVARLLEEAKAKSEQQRRDLHESIENHRTRLSTTVEIFTYVARHIYRVNRVYLPRPTHRAWG